MKNRFYDNTRVSSFRTCPRSYMFRHMLHWTPKSKSFALTFGSGWHEGMDVIWREISKDTDMDATELAKLAMEGFMEAWKGDGHPGIDDMNFGIDQPWGFRSPMTALEMYLEYIDERRNFFKNDFELVDIERPFAVPLSPTDDSLFYVGRLDKTFRSRGKLYIGEHKTTTAYKKDGPFMYAFLESFSPNSQVDGYMFGGRMIYGEKLKGIMVDAALVHKTIHDAFRFIPVERQFAQLDAWLWETHYQIDQIEANITAYEEAEPGNDYLAAFPKNTTSCANYGGCIYRGLCKMWANPKGKECPPGFKEEKWSPFEKLELAKIGLEEN